MYPARCNSDDHFTLEETGSLSDIQIHASAKSNWTEPQGTALYPRLVKYLWLVSSAGSRLKFSANEVKAITMKFEWELSSDSQLKVHHLTPDHQYGLLFTTVKDWVAQYKSIMNARSITQKTCFLINNQNNHHLFPKTTKSCLSQKVIYSFHSNSRAIGESENGWPGYYQQVLWYSPFTWQKRKQIKSQE